MRVMMVAAIVTFLVSVEPARAQDPYNVTVNVTELSRIFTELYGPEGLVVNSQAALAGGISHSAHFNSAFESEFSQFGTALTGQIVSLPLPAPASGFTYEFDPSVGVFTRSTSTFGPILSERADTIGAHRVSFGFAYQRLAFDSIEGMDLQSIPAVFTHDNAELRGGREDVITTVNSIDSEVTRSAGFITYGVSNSLDVSVAIPYISADIVVTSDATIRRIGTTIPEIHFFRAADDSIGDRRLFTAFGHASGIGDIAIRLKQSIKKGQRQGFALGLDLRLPTGDERNLLGTGAPGVQPFVAWSTDYGVLSPHINVGYQWNGSSILAGDLEAGIAADLPDVGVYSVGAVVAVHPRVTVALDVLGRYIIDTPIVRREDFHALDGRSVFPNIAFESGNINELSSAVGLKINLAGRLLLNANLLAALNDAGLRDKISPLVGVEYAF
jgi:outer membrane putative beta-barrel porin/alpha-amylase